MAARSRTRVMLTLLMAVGLALGGGVMSAPAANALSADVTCSGTETVVYQPGLLLTAQQVHTVVTGILAPCTSSDPGITAGNYAESFTTTLSCTTLLAGRSGTRVFQWNNGQSSTFTFNRALNNVGGQTTVTFTGDIISGAFVGDTVLEQVIFVSPGTLRCLAAPGLTTLGPGPAVLSITRA